MSDRQQINVTVISGSILAWVFLFVWFMFILAVVCFLVYGAIFKLLWWAGRGCYRYTTGR